MSAAILVWLAVCAAPAEAAGDRVRPVAAPDVLGASAAATLARRVAMVETELAAIWRLHLRRLGRAYTPPQIITFAGRRFGPCAGAPGVTGVHYCPADRTLSVDLVFLARLAERLGPGADLGTALVIARAAAMHVQAELAILGDAERLAHARAPEDRAALDRDVTLQADCFAGVWAQLAAAALGHVPPGGWGALVRELRTLSPEAASLGRLDLHDPDDREAAFASGRESGTIRGCLTPELSGVLG